MSTQNGTSRRRFAFVAASLAWVVVHALYAGTPAAAGEVPRMNIGYTVLDFKYKSGTEEKTVTTAVWYPTDARTKIHVYGGSTSGELAVDGALKHGGPYPLLVFSHGYGGGGLTAVFLTEELAARGWIVVSPDYNDRHSAVRIRKGQQGFDRAGLFSHAREIADSTIDDRNAYRYRYDELRTVLNGIIASPGFGPSIDTGKIALGGHSFGGYTALGLCGTLPELKDSRIKAVVLFSTGTGTCLYTPEEMAAVKMPVMLFLGERERDEKRGERTMADLADAAYRCFPATKYYLEVKGASHFSFNNRFSDNTWAQRMSGTETEFGVIRKYSVAFLERHILGDEHAVVILSGNDTRLTRYEHRETDR